MLTDVLLPFPTLKERDVHGTQCVPEDCRGPENLMLKVYWEEAS